MNDKPLKYLESNVEWFIPPALLAQMCRHGIDRDKICDACYHERAYESGDE